MEQTWYPHYNLMEGDGKIRSKGELPFLQEAERIILIYMSTKYNQNISKGRQAMEWTKYPFKIQSRKITQNGGRECTNSYTQHIVLAWYACPPNITKLSQRV